MFERTTWPSASAASTRAASEGPRPFQQALLCQNPGVGPGVGPEVGKAVSKHAWEAHLNRFGQEPEREICWPPPMPRAHLSLKEFFEQA